MHTYTFIGRSLTMEVTKTSGNTLHANRAKKYSYGVVESKMSLPSTKPKIAKIEMEGTRIERGRVYALRMFLTKRYTGSQWAKLPDGVDVLGVAAISPHCIIKLGGSFEIVPYIPEKHYWDGKIRKQKCK